jgi:hypothetical protein
MASAPDEAAGAQTSNQLSGTVAGSAVQARTIHGAVHVYAAPAAPCALAYIASVHAGTVSAGFVYPGETARSAREAGRAQSVVLALQCRYQGWARWMGCGGMGDGAGGLPSETSRLCPFQLVPTS